MEAGGDKAPRSALTFDTLSHIFSHLYDCKDLINAGMVCKEWHRTSLDDVHWKRLSLANKDQWTLIPSSVPSARFDTYREFFRYRSMIYLPRKSVDTKRMVAKLAFLLQPETEEEKARKAKREEELQNNTHNNNIHTIYSDSMLSEVLLELLCESATEEDCWALWEAYKQNPKEGGELLRPILWRLGVHNTHNNNNHNTPSKVKLRETIAEEALKRAMSARVKEDYVTLGDEDSDLLTLLGALGHEPATEFLWSVVKEGNHGTSRAAVYGLLYLSCESIREKIRETIEKECLPECLFLEFIPALSCKIFGPHFEEKAKKKEEEEEARNDWIEKLDRAIRQTAARDCSGGLLLGIALMGGEKARNTFLSIMEDEAKCQWKQRGTVDLEIYGCSTGNIRATYLSTLILSIGFQDLLKTLKARAKVKGDWEWCYRGMLALLGHRLSMPPTSPDTLPLFFHIAKEQGRLETWEEIHSIVCTRGWHRKVRRRLDREREYDLFKDLENFNPAVAVVAEQEIEKVLLRLHSAK